jgi:microcompartment protein CcmK/EutM
VILCRVVGNSVATVRHPCYVGRSVMVVRPVQPDGHTIAGDEFLAVDAVQAGPGDLILASREGNTARQLLGTDNDPFHAVILGVVDEVSDETRGMRGTLGGGAP